MPRYRLSVEYDGRAFCGWQRQDGVPSVQQALEDACARLCGSPVRVHGSGRTDSGVHALGQVAHLDLPKPLPPAVVAKALNALSRPWPVAVLACHLVDDGFHARFSALERAYVYRISVRAARPTLEDGRVWWHPKALDPERMDAAARVLVGHHDFTSFRAAECQAQSPVKTVSALRVVARGNEVLVLARARSFLHHQVRNMVGTLALVGRGKWDSDDVRRILEARDRSKAGPTAPACGLYFRAARYEGDPPLSDAPPVQAVPL